MRRAVLFAALGVAGLALLLAAAAARRRSAGIVVERDLVYGRAGGEDLKLDLARPKEGPGPFPAIVFLHGEGWRAGNRRQMGDFIEGVARMGWVGVTVEYRLVPAARFPAQIEDCKAAVRWMRANAKAHRIRPDRIGVVGFSAGGHLASLLGVTGEKDFLEGDGGNAGQSSGVQAVVSFFGPEDFTTRDWRQDLEREVIVPFLGGTFAEKPDTYRKASPVTHVTRTAAPFLLFHGREDELVPVDQSIRLAEKLKSAGASARLVILEGEKHGFTDAGNQASMKTMMEFLAETLRK